METGYSPHLVFDRATWCQFKQDMSSPLTEEDVKQLHGQYESVSMQEVIDIYLPLTRLLNYYVTASQALSDATARFMGCSETKVPYLIGVVGSVAVGKSVTSRVLQALLSKWPAHPRVAIVTTDGFLYPNSILKQKGLLQRKGFPESYDLRSLLKFLWELKSGKPELKVPVYSHQRYDITQEVQVIKNPDIVILEGLNLLQHVAESSKKSKLFVSDFLDFSIYVDADKSLLKKWFLDRFMQFRTQASTQPDSYLFQFTKMTESEAHNEASKIWTQINERNLTENILPFRERARLILLKGTGHEVEKVYLRKI